MKYSFFLFFLVYIGQLLAQTSGLPTEQVEVIKSFDARLADATKVVLTPAILDVDTSIIRQNYVIDTRPVSLAYDPPKLRPLALRREKLPEQYAGFLKAGYGLPSGPLIEAGYYFKNEDRFDAHIGFNHHSANNKQIENQKFAYTGLILDGNYHIPDKFSVEGEIGFAQNLVSFYGYNHSDTSFTKEESKQRFNRFHLGAAAYNTYSNNLGLDYRLSTKFYALNDFFDATETGIDIDLQLIKWFADSHPLRLQIGNDYSGFQDTLDKRLNNFYIRPSFTFHGDIFRIKGGLNLITVKESFRVLPDLEFLFSLAGNAFGVYAGWKGDYYQNSFDNLSTYNPFIASQYEPKSSVYHDIYGGFKGASSGWNYQAQVGYKRINDLALFLPDSMDTRRFEVLYDTGGLIYISGSAGIEIWEGLEVSGTLLQNFYSLENEAKAWHLPGLEASFGLRYNLLEDKLMLRGDAYLANGVPFKTAQEESDRLGGLLDISFRGHYQLLEKFGLWLQINNLTNNKRERWERYPTFGINVIGGLLFRF
jgi:hypothetical protein